MVILVCVWGLIAGAGWVAVQLNARFLIPFIFSAFFWLMAAVNFRDARTAVEPTGYRYRPAERWGAFFRGVCFLLMTLPIFIRDIWPSPWAYIIGGPALILGFSDNR